MVKSSGGVRLGKEEAGRMDKFSGNQISESALARDSTTKRL